MSKDKQRTPYPLRLEPELRKVLEDAAKENGNSLQAEIVKRLAESVGHYKNDDDRVRELIRDELKKAGIKPD